VDNENFALILENVLYVPQNPHNLLSLSCWDNAGSSYQGIDGKLSLTTKNQTVATGIKTTNNLYKMQNFVIQSSESMNPEANMKNKT